MNIIVNGKNTEIESALSVNELLVVSKVEMPEYVSVQINDEIIARDEFDRRIVQDSDAVEFLYYMGGGAGFH